MSSTLTQLADAITGTVHPRGGPGYEQARQDAVWNARKPERYPDVIVVADNEQDVATAVRHAREQGMRVAVRAGGHNWFGAHVRDGGMLLDLSRLRGITVDPAARTATAGAGVVGLEMYEALSAHGLFFPVGHGPDVGLSGFMLGGGYGWDSRELGPACFSILAVDAVTADGELVHCDETQNTDILWAARGGGHGQFAVITRFHLRLYPEPGALVRTAYVYPLAQTEQVVRWMMEVAPTLDRRVEFIAMATPPAVPGFEGAATTVVGLAFADSAEHGSQLLAPLKGGAPGLEPLSVLPETAADLKQLGEEVERETPRGMRYVCDNIWTHAGPDELAPLSQRVVDSMPNPASQVFWYWWGEDQTPPHAAWSAQAPWYFAVYGIGDDPALDPAHDAWVRSSLASLAPLSSGSQFADANLAERFDRPLSEANLAEMDRLRAQHDPHGVFHGYLRADAGPEHHTHGSSPSTAASSTTDDSTPEH